MSKHYLILSENYALPLIFIIINYKIIITNSFTYRIMRRYFKQGYYYYYNFNVYMDIQINIV